MREGPVAMTWDLRITYLAVDDSNWLPVLLGFDCATKRLVVAGILDRAADVATALHDTLATLGAPRRVSSDAGLELTAYKGLVSAKLAAMRIGEGDAHQVIDDDEDWVSTAVAALQARILNRGPGHRLRLEAFLTDTTGVHGTQSKVSDVAVHWYRRRWDGPDGDEPDCGPCTIYLETTAGGRFLRELRACDDGTVLRHDYRQLADRDEWRRPDQARHDDIAGFSIDRSAFEDAWNRTAPTITTTGPRGWEGS